MDKLFLAYNVHFASDCEVKNMKDQEIINSKSRTEWEALIDNWVHNEVDRQMLKRRLLDGVCFEPLAEEFNISTNHCQNRIKKAKIQLFKNI